MAVNKRATQKIVTESNVRNLNEWDVKERHEVTIRNKFAALKNLQDTVYINRA
jgi:hypothetical protein